METLVHIRWDLLGVERGAILTCYHRAGDASWGDHDDLVCVTCGACGECCRCHEPGPGADVTLTPDVGPVLAARARPGGEPEPAQGRGRSRPLPARARAAVLDTLRDAVRSSKRLDGPT